jgi:hypothetical protein
MAWLAVANWLLVVLLVLPAGGALLPSLGALTMVCLAGLATIIVFAISGVEVWAWISVGLACAGVVLATVGARSLMDDSAQILQGVKDYVKGTAALCVGMGLPFIVTAGLISAAVAGAA